MDVLDAGVFVSKWEAQVPRHAKLVLWGPLQAREMGLEGWDVQDGGETGFVVHNPGTRLTMGHATSTLIFVRRLEKAFLTIYLGGYPADAPVEQRRLDMQKAVGACEVFLSRLSKEPVRFELQGDLTLVDNVNDATVRDVPGVQVWGGRSGPGTGTGPATAPTPSVSTKGTLIDGEPQARRIKDRGTSEVWEI